MKVPSKIDILHLVHKSTACATNAHLTEAIILLKFLVKKGHNSKNIPFRVMPLDLRLQQV